MLGLQPQAQVQPEQGISDVEKAAVIAGFDNEWIKWMVKLSENKSLQDIVDYINGCEWTDRQKKTIMAYSRIVLGDGLSTTYFMDQHDYDMFYDDKAMIDCKLTLGMTVFDITSEFNILIGLIDLHFGIESRKSRGALFLRQLKTDTHEFVQTTPGEKKEKIGFK
jgi:hypothetical protein